MRGSKREKSEGVYELRVYVGRDPVTGKPRQVSRTFRGGSRGADKALRDLITELGGGVTTSKGTVGDLLDAWLRDLERRAAPNTIVNCRTFVRMAKPELGHIRLEKLGPADLDAFYGRQLDRGMKRSTVKRYHRLLSSALALAVRWEWLSDNPAARARPPTPDSPEIIPPTPQQVRALLAAARKRDPLYESAFALAAVTGMRRAELCGLRWADVDLANGMLTVRRVVSRGIEAQYPLIIKEPKTKGSRRRIPLDEVAVAMLTAHRALMESRAPEGLVPDAYVISLTPDGEEPLSPDILTHVVDRIRDDAGVPNLRLHDLRHFFASALVADGFHVRKISAALGHSRPTQTLDVYAHLFDALERDDALARSVSRVLTP